MAIATELVINTSATALDMANAIFGSGVTVVSATYTGDPLSAGTYSGATTTIPGISPTDTGVILSTGKVTDFTNSSGTTNTNTAAGTSTDTTGVNGDAQLNAVAGMATYDAAILQASFIPNGDTLTMQFVFSSEEYPEYVSGGVNDSFGVWVNGAYVPVSITVAGNVAIDEVNGGKNENLYRDNTADQFNTEMDGFTYVLSVKAPVNAGQVNTIKIGIADGGDAIYDSNLMIMADSIQTVTLAIDDDVNVIAKSTRTFDILGNDDTTSGTLTITQINGQNVVAGQTITLTSGQQVRLNADGTITVTANGVIGVENFSYTISNGSTTDVGYVTINTASGIVKDGIVSGTSAADVIQVGYLGDPDGDLVDGNDALGILGTTGNADLIYAGAGNDSITANLGNDMIYAGTGDDTVFGGAGDDLVELGSGNDSFGTTGADSAGNDSIYGEAGNDYIMTGANNDLVFGGTLNDTLYGGDGNDQVNGDSGNDILYGDAGADSLNGGADADTIYGGAGDVITGGETTTAGGSDNDILVVEAGSTITYGGGNNESGTIALASGGTLTFSEIENIVFGGPVDGTSGSDVMNAGYTDLNGDQVDGADGLNDTIFGYAGNDSINATAGDDTVYGGSGNDDLFGGAGNDSVLGGTEVDQVYGGDGNDTLDGEAGDDYLQGDLGNDQVSGGDGNDFVRADSGNDTVYGGIGNDTVYGGADNDQLYGGTGNDTLDGGSGNDQLFGAGDRDIIFGGLGDTVDGGESGDDYDVLDLSSYTHAGTNVIYGGGNNESGTVQFLNPDGTVSGTLTFSGVESVIACFTKGTMIATDKGEIAVEELAEGARVLTRDNGFAEVVWTGGRQLDAEDLAQNPSLRPVLIAKGALGQGLPLCDMMVSPQHRMLWSGPRAELLFGEAEVLIAAIHLVGQPGIQQICPKEAISYHHILFEQHEIVRGDGAWSESFQPGAATLNGLEDDQRDEILQLFPEMQNNPAHYMAARRTLKRIEARVLFAA